MAAPLRKLICQTASNNMNYIKCLLNRTRIANDQFKNTRFNKCVFILRGYANATSPFYNNKKVKGTFIGVGSLVGIASGLYGAYSYNMTSDTDLKPSDFKATKSVRNETDSTQLKLILFQYQSCPFCCKVRSMLDYYGLSYDLVEVNSVTRRQLKWTCYRKVPVLVSTGSGLDDFVEMKESSMIMSLIESYLTDRTTKIENLIRFYPETEVKDKRGKKKIDYDNKYFVMYQDNKSNRTVEEQKEEVKWRRWTDDVLVHVLSPNVYRTMSESIQTFKCFSKAGEWEQNHSSFERFTVIYVGAFVMYFVGKMLKRKYDLDADVRESLYDACSKWVKAVGKKRMFMGGDKPNLADLSVFGVLSSIEGCDAFKDAVDKTKIGPWFYRTKQEVQNHGGAHPLCIK